MGTQVNIRFRFARFPVYWLAEFDTVWVETFRERFLPCVFTFNHVSRMSSWRKRVERISLESSDSIYSKKLQV